MNEPEKNNAEHLELGKQGENLAVEYLREKGWRIAARNWRSGRGEIDIIAWEAENLLVFVEVKTRSYDNFGGPEASVGGPKQDMIAKTAGRYMELIDYEWIIRFDVISLIFRKGKLLEIRHVEDAFFPTR